MATNSKTRVLLRRSRPSLGQKVSARATVVSVVRDDSSTSRQLTFQDEFSGLLGSDGAQIIIPTPFNVPRMFELIGQSNMLQQCIDAYATNTVMTGWEVEPSGRTVIKNEGEEYELQSFLDNANSEESLTTVMDKVIRDRESVGFGFLEVIRDISNFVSLLRHAPSLYTRLCPKHSQEVLVEYDVSRGRRVSTVKEFRRFRRFMQLVNGKQVWFKEFGDPRDMDYRNGAYKGESGYEAGYPATEIIHFKRPSNEPYGVPQWVNQIPSIIGSRESEEVNMRYFQDNTVPPMMLLVGNGRLTRQSYQELTQSLNGSTAGNEPGRNRQNKIMLIEAVGEGDSLDSKGSAIELKVEKLTDTRQSDGLFRAYDEANMGKVRSSFRLPPVVVGMSQDVNFATANVSAFIAESQVFAPARQQIDESLNKLLVGGRSGMMLRSVKLVSRTPSITSPDMVIKTMTALNVMGAITPRQAQRLANKMLQMEMVPYPEKDEPGYEEWMDKPIIFEQKKATTAQDGQPSNHDAQNQKDATTKAVEDTGTVSQTPPENGAQ